MNDERDDPATRDVDEAYRSASSTLDERPDARVRAGVLAAAARAVDAKPRDVATPFRAQRRGWSIAAVLVVSVMTGLVAMQASRERPDLVDGRSTARVEVPSPRADIAMAPSADTTTAPPASSPVKAPISTPERARSDVDRPTASAAREVVRPAPARRPAPGSDARRETAAQPFPNAAADATAPVDKTTPAPRRPASFADEANGASPPAPSADTSQAPSAQAAPAPPTTTDLHVARSSSNEPSMRAKTQIASTHAADEDDPTRWAARIARLRAAGRDDEADRELVKLRARHPSFVVPRDALPTDTRP